MNRSSLGTFKYAVSRDCFLSLLCYDQVQFEYYCKERFPDSIFHSRETDTDFFGFLNHQDGSASVFVRGTGGKTKDQRKVSWGRNAAAGDVDGDNEHDGFEMSAQSFLHHFGRDLTGFLSVAFFGHSAGASISPLIAYDVAVRCPNIEISGRTFCAAPPGNAQFKRDFERHIKDWRHREMKGDLIRTAFMRNQKSEILDGADVGLREELPVCSPVQYIPGLRLLAHSPRLVVRSCMKAYPDAKKELKWILERCVN
jgi:hypothetical protein